MKHLIYYFLESNICLLAFLGIFILLLRNENNFKVNRFYLLFSIVVSVILPILPLNRAFEPSDLNISAAGQVVWLPEVIISAGKATSEYLDWFATTEIWTFLTVVYFIGLVVSLSNFSIQLSRLTRLLVSADVYKWKNCRVMESKEGSGIFSFFNFIFIGCPVFLSNEEKVKILEHEKIHSDQLHSIDIILSDLLINFFWFNPLIRIYKKKLIQQHEFEADSRAVENSEVNDYCNLLARVALGTAGFLLANHFNNSLTIKRITMMQTTKKKIHRLKIAGLILIFPAIAFIIACQKDAINENEKTSASFPQDDVVFTVVEKVAEFPGGQLKLGEFLGKNLKYPEVSAKNGVEGTIFVSFVIDHDGTVRDPEIVKGISPECDKEALRVISLSPKWIPAEQSGKQMAQKMTLPIKFKIASDKIGKAATGNWSPEKKGVKITTMSITSENKNRIKGTVLDENNEPIEGANVVQLGTTRGTTTDTDGNFSLEPMSASGELVISHDDYSTHTIAFSF